MNINSELKLQIAFLIERYIQQIQKKVPSVAWLEIETDSILIREKRKHLFKTSDRVSKMFGAQELKV